MKAKRAQTHKAEFIKKGVIQGVMAVLDRPTEYPDLKLMTSARDCLLKKGH